MFATDPAWVDRHRRAQTALCALANAQRIVPSSGDKYLRVHRVIVLLCSSRGGSSIFKTALAQSRSIAALAGEMEPYYILAGNGWPFEGFRSDAGPDDGLFRNLQVIRDCVFDELDCHDINDAWRNRLALQFPECPGTHPMMAQADYYDQHEVWWPSLKPAPVSWETARRWKIEEPPFVVPRINLRLSEDQTLLFKTPQDVYRPGLYEALFPMAEIVYVHLRRNFASTVNGLLDGWAHPVGFFSHRIGDAPNRQWWKFDAFPTWYHYWAHRDLTDIAFEQWWSAHTGALGCYYVSAIVYFEQFIRDPPGVIRALCEQLDLQVPTALKLPVTMATAPPSERRWMQDHDRQQMLLAKYADRAEPLMTRLGYTMNPETWL